MADDNILSAVLGALQGAEKTTNMFLEEAFRLRRNQADLEAEMKLYPQKLALQNQAESSKLAMQQPYLLEQVREKAKIERPSEYVSGADVLLGRPDLAGNIDPSAKINKAMLPFLKPPTPKETTEGKEAARRAAKLKFEFPKAQGSFEKTKKDYDAMINLAKKIRDDPSLGEATGYFGGRQNFTAGARRVGSDIETLKSKTLINVLGSLKELSSTGASGFGQLSGPEGESLRNSIVNLDRKIGTPDFKKNLDEFIRQAEGSKNTVANTFEQTYGQFEPNLPVLDQQGEEVKRKTKDGRVAIFDAATKKFLRYE